MPTRCRAVVPARRKRRRWVSPKLLAILHRSRPANVDDVGWNPEEHCPGCARDRAAQREAEPAVQDSDPGETLVMEARAGAADGAATRMQAAIVVGAAAVLVVLVCSLVLG